MDHGRLPKNETHQHITGLIALNGAVQHSYPDPFDRTSLADPNGSTDSRRRRRSHRTIHRQRDAGTMMAYAGTPYAHLHTGDLWEATSITDPSGLTMTYHRAR
jgi:hypothetical protein